MARRTWWRIVKLNFRKLLREIGAHEVRVQLGFEERYTSL